MIEFVGLILGVLGIAFAFEKPRIFVLNIFRFGKNKKIHAVPYNVDVAPVHDHKSVSSIYGATHSGRYPFFIGEPISTLKEASAVARSTGKPVFLVVYDENHPSKSQLYYSLGCFMDYFTTKRLVQDHFVVALVPSTDKDAISLVPADDPLENCLWVVLGPDGHILRREGVYANADEGLKRVRALVSVHAKA
ncbi:hypothetical protein [Pseudomonas sp. TE3911]|jgi:hypothetical protein